MVEPLWSWHLANRDRVVPPRRCMKEAGADLHTRSREIPLGDMVADPEPQHIHIEACHSRGIADILKKMAGAERSGTEALAGKQWRVKWVTLCQRKRTRVEFMLRAFGVGSAVEPLDP